MELGGENEGVNSCAAEIDCQIVEVATNIGEWLITELRHYQGAALDANLEAIGSPHDGAQGFVRPIQAL